jgi:hypothetical protein
MEKLSFVTLNGESLRRAALLAPRSRQNSDTSGFLPPDFYPWQWLMKNK